MNNDKQKLLRELIINNPDADIKIFAGQDSNFGDYSYQLNEITMVEIESLTYYNEKFYNQENMKDYLFGILNKGQSEYELEKEVEKIIKTQKWEKSICIYID